MKDKLFTLIKKIFSFKVFIIVVIISLFSWNVISNSRLGILMNDKNFIQNEYLMTTYLTKIASNIEGENIDNIVLKNISGYTTFDSLFKNKDYMIVIYQNGLVCSPCLEFAMGNWTKYKKNFNKNLSQEMIIINYTVDGKVLRYLNSVNSQKLYYIDSNNYIHDHIVKIDKPTNFLLFINKKRQIIFATYFSIDSRENFIDFITKVNRFLDNRT